MLYKKMLRDLSDYKIQFISVFLMAFVGVFIFAGVGGEANCLEVNIDNFYNDTNLADGWIFAGDVSSDFQEKVNDLNSTTASERQLVISSVANFSNSPVIELHFVENNTISTFYLAEGKELNLSDENGVWLDKKFADEKGLNVGDNISFKFNGMTIEKEIRGLGYSPEYVYNLPYYAVKPNHTEYGFAYMSHNAFPLDNVQYNVLYVKFNGNDEDFEDGLSDKLDGDYSSFMPRQSHTSVKVYQGTIEQFKMIG
ncbi:MAG: cell division protein FtsX, partial [Methanobrevibacter sp.]|nr:cell division protein FtsX [Methanobrevibacter sp.]